MYIINFEADIEGLGGDELDEKLTVFNCRNEILLNKPISINYNKHEYEQWFKCQTEDRLLDKLLVQITKSFDIFSMEISKTNN